MRIDVRDATSDDVQTIVAFNTLLANESEDQTLDPAVIGPGVDAVLRDPAKGRYWVAETDGRIVGQMMVTYEWSDWRSGMLWWIQSVYVHAEHRRAGIFSCLFRHVRSLAANDPKVCGLRLYVDDANTRAQQTYEALGMSMTGYRVMESIFDRES